MLKEYGRLSRCAGVIRPQQGSPLYRRVPSLGLLPNGEHRQPITGRWPPTTEDYRTELDAIDEALCGLSDKPRYLLTASYCEQVPYSFAELADRLGLKRRGEVAWHKSTALLLFARLYKGGELIKQSRGY